MMMVSDLYRIVLSKIFRSGSDLLTLASSPAYKGVFGLYFDDTNLYSPKHETDLYSPNHETDLYSAKHKQNQSSPCNPLKFVLNEIHHIN